MSDTKLKKLIERLRELETYLEDVGDSEARFSDDLYDYGFDSGTDHAADKLNDILVDFE